MEFDRIKRVLIPETSPLIKAIETIDKNELGIALVIDGDERLTGTITDGDIRRGLLRGLQLEESVTNVMKTSPHTVTADISLDEIKHQMESFDIHQMPVLDGDGRVVDLIVDSVHEDDPVYENEVIIMAGGLGQRLRPLTETVPKPMLEVNGKPILETILEGLREQGLRNFTICLNYLGEMIEDYFGDGSSHGINITYTRENRRMGTGGALSLLEKKPTKPCIVMNGDIVTNLNFRQLLQYHREHSAKATIALNEYSINVPFGVIETENSMVTNMVEKPVHTYFVNAGIYMLSPSCFDAIEHDTDFDMPDLISRLMEAGDAIAGFPVFEYWIDVGRHSDLAIARNKDGAKQEETSAS